MAVRSKQLSLFKTPSRHKDQYGGSLRNERVGRRARPLSTKHSIHLVFKSNLAALPKGLRHPHTQKIIHAVLRQYSRKFFVKIEQISIQRDHIHCIIRAYRRSSYASFFRVVAGQIAQRVTDTFTETYTGPRVWKSRPFSCVVRSFKYRINVRNYIQLNEKEALGLIQYRKQRLKGMTAEELSQLWI